MFYQKYSDILQYLHSEGIKTHKKGKEWASPCLFDGGTDRFIIRIDKYGFQYFWCRRCGRSGNLIHLIKEHKKISYKEALKLISRPPSPNSNKQYQTERSQKTGSQVVNRNLWNYRTAIFCKKAQKQLRYNRKKLMWLKTERGINKKTALKAGLGYHPFHMKNERSDWGLDDQEDSDGNFKQVHLPEALVIPKFRVDGQVIRLRFRIFDTTWKSKYFPVPGSKMSPLLLGNRYSKQALVVESDLDAILLHQEISDILIISLGSVSYKLTNTQLSLLCSKDIFISLDNDDAGSENMVKLIERYPVFRILPVIDGKDHTESYLNGVDLREWFKEGIKS